jgi:hypothetical protein
MPCVVGVGRSGTTLMRLMLDAHPELAIPPETHFLHLMHRHEQQDAAAFLRTLTGVHTWADFHVDALTLGQELARSGSFDLANAIRTFYWLYAERQGKPRFGDKTPYNAECMDHIHGLLPEARFIHIIRDGRDVALSYRDKWFGPGQDLEKAIRFWSDRIRHAREQAQHLPDNVYLEVRYEDLIMSAEDTLKKICRFVDLPFNPHMLRYYETASQRLEEIQDHRNQSGQVIVPRSQHLSIHVNTHRPPDPNQIEKWRSGLTPDEQEFYWKRAGDLLTELGYSR